jgi:serine/threonine protein kinase
MNQPPSGESNALPRPGDATAEPEVSASHGGADPNSQTSGSKTLLPPSIPDYELFQRIGGGAYGDVWLARSATSAWRALKIVWRHTFENDRPFQREFEGIQHFERLSREHPSQLALFHVGRGEGYFYYVMELADDNVGQASSLPVQRASSLADPNAKLEASPPAGKMPAPHYVPHTLRADLALGRLPAARILEIGLALTEALSHLHTNGLVHRDVKPSNVIFVNGRPKLADIGLVTDAGDTRSIVGTEGYLAPEGPGTPQADLFALGKVLYEGVIGLDRRDFPKLPEDLRTWPDAKLVFELNEIILKASDSEARRRYQSAEEMRADLELLQRGKSVQRKRALQHWLAVSKKAGLAVALLSMVVAAAVVFRQHSSDPYLHSAIPGVDKLVEQGNSVVQGRSAERIRTALGYYNEAVQLDPNFVPARFGVFTTLVYRGGAESGAPDELRRELRAVAKKLMELNSNLAESRTASSTIPQALADARLATQKRAASREGESAAHNYYGYFLLQTGKPDEALEQYQQAEEKSPAGAMIHHHLGHPYFVKRDFERALKHYQESLRLAPAQGSAHHFIGRVYEEQTNFLAAIQEFRERERLDGEYDNERAIFYDTLREAVQKGGAEGYWRKRLDIALGKSQPDLYYVATLYARLGEKDKAYVWLKKACEKRAFDQGLMFDLCWDHSDPEFVAIAKGIRLLQ